jgi:hypothetical protein
MEADGSWWGPWSSKPEWGVKSVPGVFDPHTPPPSLFRARSMGDNGRTGRYGRAQQDHEDGDGMQRRVLGMLACVALVSLAMTGCTQIQQILTPTPVVNKVTIEATAAVPGAPVTGRLAKGMPKDLPLWPGSAVSKSILIKSGSGNTWSATLTTPDPYSDVLNGVGVGFQKGGWDVAAQDVSSAEISSTVMTVSGPTVDGVVTVTGTKKGTVEITYSMAAKQQ